MSFVSKHLVLAVIAIPASVWAGSAPYENATSKAISPGHYAPRMYAQPRGYYYSQPRVYSQPNVATANATQERRVFSYEPAPAMNYQRQTYSYEPQYDSAPSYNYAPARHTWQNATMKGLGRVQ